FRRVLFRSETGTNNAHTQTHTHTHASPKTNLITNQNLPPRLTVGSHCLCIFPLLLLSLSPSLFLILLSLSLSLSSSSLSSLLPFISLSSLPVSLFTSSLHL